MLANQPLTLSTTVSAEIGESHFPYGAAFELMAVQVRVESGGGQRKERGHYVHVKSPVTPVTGEALALNNRGRHNRKVTHPRQGALHCLCCPPSSPSQDGAVGSLRSATRRHVAFDYRSKTHGRIDTVLDAPQDFVPRIWKHGYRSRIFDDHVLRCGNSPVSLQASRSLVARRWD